MKKTFALTTLTGMMLLALSSGAMSHGTDEHADAVAQEMPTGWAPRAKGANIDGGAWSPVEDWPVLAVHATLLPNGSVFAWDATPDDFDTNFDGTPTNYHDAQRNQTRVTVWNPKTNQHMSTYNPEGTGDLFCAGSVHLPDGRIIFAGGDSGVGGKNGASANSNIYDPWTNSWSTTDNMAAARWYSSVVSLSNGEVLTLGGSYDPTPYAEILQHNKQWRSFNGGQSHDTTILSGDYAWMAGASDGAIVYVGPHNKVDSLYTDDLFETDTWIVGEKRDAVELPGELGSYRGYGSYAMYDKDRVLVSGGGSSVKSSVVIDLKNKTTVETSPMNFGRRQHNLTILADGSVLATGGNSTGADLYDPDSGVLTPEIWSPETGQWDVMNDAAVDRQYHSIALLLPDARVLLAGSGYCVPCFTYDHQEQNGEIFSPPYLFKGPRPVITAAPERVNYDTDIALTVQNGITAAHLIKMSSVTHSQSQDQRLVKLNIKSQEGGNIVLESPESRLLAPPGHYMLFVVKDGVPSEAAIINLGQSLLETGDVMLSNARPAEWEYYEIKGRDDHTLTVNLNGNLNAVSMHVKSGSWPTNTTDGAGFDSCIVISADQEQCVVSANDDSRWFIGVHGKANSEFSISVDLKAGNNTQGNDFVAVPEGLKVTQVSDDGSYQIEWQMVPDARQYEIFRDGRMTNNTFRNVHTMIGLHAMRTYAFQVLAIKADGSRSALSDAVEIRTSNLPYVVDPTAIYNPIIPSIPVGVRMFKTSADQGTLLWERSFDDKGIFGYDIYRNNVLIGTRDDAGISLEQEGLVAGETYTYEVVSIDEDGNRSARSAPFVTNGSLFVDVLNTAPPPAKEDADFVPVEYCGWYCVPSNPTTPDLPDSPDATPPKKSGGGRLDILMLTILMIGLRRKLLLLK